MNAMFDALAGHLPAVAGVSTSVVHLHGGGMATSGAADVGYRVMPEVFEASIRDVSGFAKSLGQLTV
ncbi:hypothetical protein [Mycobacterium sp. URHB0021]|jgi:hypothetical protein